MSGRFDEAIARFDAAHAEDPEQDGAGAPKELLYAQRMSAWLEKLAPQASESLRLATRCQHIRRWAIPRSDYPEGKVGYLRWRKEESLAHAALAGEVLEKVGYDAAAVKRVQSLIKKERIKHDEAKLIDILHKTWGEMSPQGHDAALALDMPRALRAIMHKALSR